MERGEAPRAKRTAKSRIRLVKRQDRRAQGTDMDNVVTLVCKRFRHVKWRAGPEPDLACVANRGECDPPRSVAACVIIQNQFAPLQMVSNSDELKECVPSFPPQSVTTIFEASFLRPG
jgi:hypothetical protein